MGFGGAMRYTRATRAVRTDCPSTREWDALYETRDPRISCHPRIVLEDVRPRHEQGRWSERPSVLAPSPLVGLVHSAGTDRDQLVQASVAGVVVEVAAPPVAVMPVSDGKEK
jgi:hypothetical protein